MGARVLLLALSHWGRMSELMPRRLVALDNL